MAATTSQEYLINVKPYFKAFVLLGVVGMAVVPLWIFVGFYPTNHINDAATAGQFGDSFGFATSLFSSFAFIAAIVAVIMQIVETHESGKQDIDRRKLAVRQIRLTRMSIRVQERVQQQEERKEVRSLFLKLNGDVTRFVKWASNFTPGRAIRYTKERQSLVARDLSSAESKRRYEEATLDLQDNVLSVQLLLGDRGTSITTAINELMAIDSDRSNQFYHRDLKKCAEQLRQEVDTIWKAFDSALSLAGQS